MDSDPTREPGSAPNFVRLRRLAWQNGRILVKSRANDPAVYTLVQPDFWGKGSDPSGNKAAQLAFDNGHGMTIEEIAEELGL